MKGGVIDPSVYDSVQIDIGNVLLSREEAVHFVAEVVKRGRLLEFVCGGLKHSEFDGLECGSIFSPFLGLTSLTHMSLRNSSLKDFGLRNLLSGIDNRYTRLEYIDLRWNQIGDLGMESLCVVLATNDTVRKIMLGGNEIGNEGLTKLALVLKENTSLSSIDMWSNRYDSLGLKEVAAAMEMNHSVIEFSLDAPTNPNEEDQFSEKIELLVKRNRKSFHKKRKQLNDTIKESVEASWNRARVMLVGQGKAGKSATVRSLLGLSFNPQWDSTIGADVSETEARKNGRWLASGIRENQASKVAARLAFGNSSTVEDTPAKDKIENPRVLKPTAKTIGPKTFIPYNGKIWEDSQKAEVDTAMFVDTSDKKKVQKKGYQGGLDYEYDESLHLSANSLNLSLWDFGGQEVFYSMHHIFLTENGVYLLVFDMRELLNPQAVDETSKYLLFWLRSVRLHAPDSSLILVGTFLSDLEKGQEDVVMIDRFLKKLAREKFPQIRPNTEDDLLLFPIDNRYNLGILPLKRAIERIVHNDPKVAVKIPMRWLRFLDSMLSKRKHTSCLSIKQVAAIARDMGVTSVEEQEDALRLFHNRGAITHLTGSETLHSIVTIRPQWLLDNLSLVIRDGDLHQLDEQEIEKAGLGEDVRNTFTEGIASRDFLEFVWKYNTDFFVDLMRSAMLLSDWNFGTDRSYLIPSQLKTVNKDHVQAPRCLFNFSESFLPMGVFQRLVSLCVIHGSRHLEKGKPSMRPELYKNFAVVEIEPNFVVRIGEDTDDQTISLSSAPEFAQRGFKIVTAMIQKISYDVMKSRLKWDVQFQSKTSDECISLLEAQNRKLFPWFSNAKDDEQNSAHEHDLNSFLKSL